MLAISDHDVFSDLSLALQSHPIGQHLHVIFILLILLITILFCHSLIRFCMLVLLTPLADKGRRSPADEEAAVYVNQDRLAEVLPDPLGTDSSEPTVPPPAYGLWRGSVVCSSFTSSKDRRGWYEKADIVFLDLARRPEHAAPHATPAAIPPSECSNPAATTASAFRRVPFSAAVIYLGQGERGAAHPDFA